MTMLFIWIVTPVLILVVLVGWQRLGGMRAMWTVALAMAGFLFAFSLLMPDVLFYWKGPLNAAGVRTWPFPYAPLLAALIVTLLSLRWIPSWVRVLPAVVVVWLVVMWESWVA